MAPALVNRRIGLLFAIFLFLLIAAAGRAAWLGGVQARDLRQRAVAQQEEDLTVPARRGTITDRNGVELAVSEDAITVFANPFLIDDPSGVAAKVAPLVGRPAEDVQLELSDPTRGFVYLARSIDPSKGAAVEDLQIEGIGTVVEPKRQYPQDAMASQLLGAVGVDGYGLAGIEQSQEEALHGIDGRRSVVKDALGKPVSIVEHERAVSGQDIRLTLDTAIQARVEKVLAEVGNEFEPKGATALVMDPRNGEMLAMANWPQVNPKSFGDADDYVRQNRAVAASYEPGSTFKAITVSGALEEDLVSPGTVFDLPPSIQVADRVIEEAHDRGAVALSVAEILAQSSNVGAITIGLQLGPRRFNNYVRQFGFGEGTGVDVPGEATGIVPRPKEYSGSSMGNLPMGQGLAVTPIQLAAAYSAIANDGVLVTPHVIQGEPPQPRRVVSAGTAKRVARMLEGVLGAGGTASEASVEGYRLAGKTGTAEKPDGYGGYSESAFVGSFVGFAPARDPRLLVAVAVDEPQGSIYGSVVAAPAFEKIVEFALPYLRIPPE
jgi:cell division protein FtsI (penicillin-binding protein 3)